MTERKYFNAKTRNDLLSDIYNEAKSFKILQKPNRLKPLSKSPVPDRTQLIINEITKNPKKFSKNSNSPNLNQTSRPKLAKQVFPSPLKLPKIQLTKAPIPESSSIPVQSAPPSLPSLSSRPALLAEPIKPNKPDKPAIAASSPKQPKKSSKQRYSFLKNDLNLALSSLRTQSKSPTDRFSPVANHKALCSVLKNLEKQCDLSNDLNSSGEIESFLVQTRKSIKHWTERLNWTASKIHQLGEFEDPVLKELYFHDLTIKCSQEVEAESIQKSLLSKSSTSLRSQAKIIRKVLIRNKLKLL